MNLFKEKISRREFIKKAYNFLAGLSLSSLLFDIFLNKKAEANIFAIFSKEAMFYKKLANDIVQCEICFRGCKLTDGQRSFCLNRENRGGKLYSIIYARPSVVHVDPIEKEPALHMLPSTDILCFGTAGCNFRCKFCHNWHLSQRPLEEMEYTYDLSPEAAVEIAIKKKIPTLSFTYNEPTSFYEYVYDTAKIAKQRGLKILWHSNGSMNPKPLKELLKYTDSVTIDLKGFTQEFYQNVSSAALKPVLKTLKIIRQEDKWLEIVNLQIPTLNDNPKDVERMCYWIKENLGKDTPLHFSRFSPSYKLTNLYHTPIETLERSYSIAKKCGLNYVTIGNVPGHKYNSTFCPGCGKNIIYRKHFMVLENNVVNGKCKFCSLTIPGIWS
ncbi:MAG: AmmeMemoRadiSam system radical SAM enzyme [Candidatus Omnitrophica bacterium]|nr:AmmeMemoRadiSam system radical SAM enzyme [Candidatus Omnitrophota bacterium]